METDTITVAPAACFYPREASGFPHEVGDGVPHWHTASEGWRQLRALRLEQPGLEVTLAREPERRSVCIPSMSDLPWSSCVGYPQVIKERWT